VVPARREGFTVAGAFLLYGSVFFDRLAPLYLVGLVAADLGVPSAWEGTLALCIGLGWATAMPLVRATTGLLTDRRRILLAAGVSGTVSLLSSTAPGWVVFVLLRGLGGLASGSGAPAVTSLVFSSAPEERRGRDLGIVQSSTRLLGSFVSPVVVTAVAVAAGWRAAIATSGTVLLVGAVLLAVLVPRGTERAPGRHTRHDFRYRPGGRRNVWLCTVACAVLLGWLTVWSQSSVAVIRTWLEVGPDAAGRYVGVFGVGAAAGALLLPVVSDRIGRRHALGLAAVLGGSGGLAVGGLAAAGARPPAVVLWAALFLAGSAMGGLPLVISIVPAETVAIGDVGRALTIPIAGGEVFGSSALPLLAAAAAVPLGRPVVLMVAAAAVVGLVAVAALLRPLAPSD
jgi:MFS family permease